MTKSTLVLNSNHCGLERLKERHCLWTAEILVRNRLFRQVYVMRLENGLRPVNSTAPNLFHGRAPLSEICSDLSLARSTPSGPSTQS